MHPLNTIAPAPHMRRPQAAEERWTARVRAVVLLAGVVGSWAAVGVLFRALLP